MNAAFGEEAHELTWTGQLSYEDLCPPLAVQVFFSGHLYGDFTLISFPHEDWTIDKPERPDTLFIELMRFEPGDERPTEADINEGRVPRTKVERFPLADFGIHVDGRRETKPLTITSVVLDA